MLRRQGREWLVVEKCFDYPSVSRVSPTLKGEPAPERLSKHQDLGEVLVIPLGKSPAGGQLHAREQLQLYAMEHEEL